MSEHMRVGLTLYSQFSQLYNGPIYGRFGMWESGFQQNDVFCSTGTVHLPVCIGSNRKLRVERPVASLASYYFKNDCATQLSWTDSGHRSQVFLAVCCLHS